MRVPSKPTKLKASKAMGSPNLKQAQNNREARRMANRIAGNQPRIKKAAPAGLAGVYVGKGKPTDMSKRVNIAAKAAAAKKPKSAGAMNKAKANRKMGY